MFKKKIDWVKLRDYALAVSPMLILGIIVIYIGYRYIDPAPPKKIVISAGDVDGNYFAAAKQYQELIKPEGIEVEIRTSTGAKENLTRLEDPNSGVDVGFIQDGLGNRKKTPDVSSLGSLFYEPVWVFYRGKKDINRLSQLIGMKIGMGATGSETHIMAKKLLTASGLDEKNSKWVEIAPEEETPALKNGQVDAAFYIASASDPAIVALLKDPTVKVMSFDQADAITKQFPYLHHLVLPHGTMDLQKNIPNRDVDLVGATATLITRNSVHPALLYLLLKAAQKTHRPPGIFEARGEFPIDKDFVFPLNSEAKDFFKSGAPFWLRYLPFWLAIIVQRFLFLVLPVTAIVIPLLRLIPRFLDWRIRSRIHQGYGELKLLEDQIKSDALESGIKEYHHRLDGIENRLNEMNFPVDVFDDVYILREHIHFVRERLERMSRDLQVRAVGSTGK